MSARRILNGGLFVTGLLSSIISGCGKQDPSFLEDQEGPYSDRKRGVNLPGDTGENSTVGSVKDINSINQGPGVNGGGGGGGGGNSGGGKGSENPPSGTLVNMSLTAPNAQSKVDILWVVDTSGSMKEEQAYLGNNFSSFMSQLSMTGMNFQTAVTTTDICQDSVPDDLSQRVCPADFGGSSSTHLRGSFVTKNGGPQVLTMNDPMLLSRFSSYTNLGTNGSGFEHGLKGAEMGIAKSLSGANSPLIRTDAFLAVIVVSDEEDDGIGLGMANENGTNYVAQGLTSFRYTDDDFVNYLSSVKGAGKFSVSAITGTRNANGSLCSADHSQPDEEGTQYIKAAQKTGGIVQSICETNWSSSLAQIGNDVASQMSQVVLKSIPDPATIKVKVNGAVTVKWSYVSGSNAVKFNTGYVPAAGSSIEISYLVK